MEMGQVWAEFFHTQTRSAGPAQPMPLQGPICGPIKKKKKKSFPEALNLHKRT